MARIPQPTAVRKLKGNPGKRPLPKEPEFANDTKPDCPDWIDGDGKLEWKRVCDSLWDAGILKSVDLQILAAYCAAYSRWKRAETSVLKSGQVIKSEMTGNFYLNPFLTAAQIAMKEMITIANYLGMTPSGRTRVSITKPKTKSLAEMLFSQVKEK